MTTLPITMQQDVPASHALRTGLAFATTVALF